VDLRSQLQEHLGAGFALERELGGGGMSRVFLANEVRLSRRVVIKLLNEELAHGLNAERFEREILLVASLQQANIVPVLSAGEVGGVPYFTMPFVEGESLRARLRGSALPIGDVVAILRDVSRALAYAHGHGVVHRDIKPDNVLLSGGTAVVTDFGIAKAVAASQGAGTGAMAAGAALTQTGTSLGTPAYMAPEQVAGDPDVDHRVDLYSLGCLAFELITGRPPFVDRTPQRMLAAHLSETPAPPLSLRPDCPVPLSDLVLRLLEKDPGRRPQSAAEVLATLDSVLSTSTPTMAFSPVGTFWRALGLYVLATAMVALLTRAAVLVIGLPEWVFPGAMVVMLLGLPALLVTGYVQRITRRAATATPTLTPGGTLQPQSPSGTVATMALKAGRHLSWRRTAHGGMVAMGGFVVLVAGFMALRALGIGPAGSLLAAGKLAADDRIVLANFTAAPEDSALGDILVEAVRAALSQSRSIRLLAPADIAAELGRMQRDKAAPLDQTPAREVATRGGAKAVLGGRLARVGNGFAVSLELTSADAGAPLASFQATADGPGELLTVVDGLTRKLRGKIGESLRTVQHSIPLERATTPSLEALRKYSEAVTANDVDLDYDRAVRAAREAVALDSTFALAWRKLAVALGNGAGSRAAQDSALEQAARYADRLPDREKYLALGAYYTSSRAGADRGKGLAAYQAAYAADSTGYVAANRLTALYESRRQYDSAQRYAEREYRLSPTLASAMRLAEGSARNGHLAEASARIDSAVRASPEAAASLPILGARAAVYTAREQYDSAALLFAGLTNSPSVPMRVTALGVQIGEALLTGRLARTEVLDSERTALLAARGAAARIDGVTRAALDIHWRGRVADGVQRLDAIVSGRQWAAADPKDRPYGFVATLYAWGGQPAKARQVMARYATEDPSGAKAPDSRPGTDEIQAEIALAEGRYDEALRRFRAADVGSDGAPQGCEDCAYFNYARVFDRAGRKDSALANYERVIEIPAGRRQQDWLFLAATHKRLGELYDERQDRERALAHYAAFVDLWKNADPVLQPMVATVRSRLGELAGQEGR
jgi:tRNA A-37 threonylcarbamoyl transferase component Bud32/TolB-like protein